MAVHNPIDIVDLIHCPGGEPEKRLRRRILKARDWSSVRAWDSSWPDVAREDFIKAQDIANAWLTRPATIEQLTLVIRWITAYWLAASSAERIIGGEGDGDGE